MALDKVVDSAVLDAEMTSVANAIRAKTGNTDMLAWPDGFATAIAEITGGGGAGLAYDMGEFVLDADVKVLAPPSLPHNLGEIPEFILVWTDDFAGLSEENPAAQQCNLGYIWLKNLCGLMQRLTTVATGNALTVNLISNNADYRIQLNSPTSAVYLTQQPTAEGLGLNQTGSNFYWRAGVTYKYFVSKAWWNVGGAANVE